MTMGPDGNYDENLQSGKNTAKSAIQSGKNAGTQLGNTAQAAIEKAKASKNATEAATSAGKEGASLFSKLVSALKNPGSFFGNLQNLASFIPVVFGLIILIIFISMSLSDVLHNGASNKSSTQTSSISYVAPADPDQVANDLIVKAVHESYEKTITRVQKQIEADAKKTYENYGQCTVRLVVGPKEIKAEKDDEEGEEDKEKANDKEKDVITELGRGIYSEETICKLISSRLFAVTGILNKMNSAAVSDGITSSSKESGAEGISAAYTNWYSTSDDSAENAETDNDSAKDDVAPAVDDTQADDLSDEDNASETNAEETTNKPGIGVAYGQEYNNGEQNTEAAAEDPSDQEEEKPVQEKKQESIDYEKLGESDYLPSVLEKSGNQFTNLYSAEALQYLVDYTNNSRTMMIWPAPKREWESEDEGFTIEHVVEKNYEYEYFQDGYESMGKRLKYGTDVYYSKPTDNQFMLCWTDTINFFQDGEDCESGINRYGVNYKDIMKTYHISENMIDAVGGSVLCYVNGKFKPFEYSYVNESGNTVTISHQKEPEPVYSEEEYDVEHHYITYYVPFYYDLTAFHEEEIENVKKAVQYKNPDSPMEQSEASKFVDDMLDAEQRDYLDQHGGYGQLMDVIKMKRYSHSSSGGVVEVGDVKIDFSSKYYTFSTDPEVGNPNVCDAMNTYAWPYNNCDPPTSSTGDTNKMICCSYAAGRYWEVNYPDDPFPLSPGWGQQFLDGVFSYVPVDVNNPVEHSIVCFECLKFSHVGFIEAVFSDGSVIISESNISVASDDEYISRYGFRVQKWDSVKAWMSNVSGGVSTWLIGYLPPDAGY